MWTRKTRFYVASLDSGLACIFWSELVPKRKNYIHIYKNIKGMKISFTKMSMQ